MLREMTWCALLAFTPDWGDSTIRGMINGHEVVITTTARVAGAVHSLRWRGMEFLNSTDHGRQLQSASNFDFGTPITAETFNPTEAGSRTDHIGPTSSSKLLEISALGGELKTKSYMAFWLAPGQKSGMNMAKNTTVLSNHLLEKRVVISSEAIDYTVTYTFPKNEQHSHAVLESLTGYMPPEFSSFYRFDRIAHKLVPLSDGPGEQPDPVALATADGKFAMGIYSPDQPAKGFEKLGYGRWKFHDARVVKWNCVFRLNHPAPGGKYTYHHKVLIGSLADVESGLHRLTKG